MNATGASDLLNPNLEVDPSRTISYRSTSMSVAGQEVFAVLVAALIGLSAGLLVVWFRLAIDAFRLLLQGRWFVGPRIIVVPAIGALIAAVLVQKFSRLHAGAITETRASIYLNNGYVSLRTTVVEFLASALSIGAGQPLGPEDPLLHVGAGLSSFLGRSFQIPRERLARLAPVGAAAGLAGALNAPLAAVLFVIEAVVGSWTAPAQVGLILVGSLSSVAVVRYFLGSQSLFHMPAVHANPRELLSYVIIGVIAGLAGLLFDHLIRFVRVRIKRLPAWSYLLQVGMAGIAVGAVAYVGVPQVLGAGYNFLGQMMYGQFGWRLLLLLAAAKLLFAGFAFAARIPGGLIAPTLFIGAMVGSAAAGLQHAVTGHPAASAPAFVLLGMVALFAAVLRTPLAAILLVIEFSRTESMIIPGIVAVAAAWLLAVALQRQSLLEFLRDLDGMHLPEIQEQKPAPVLKVEDAMLAATCPVVDGTLTLREAWREVSSAAEELIFVRNADSSWTTIERSLLDRLEATSDAHQRLQDVTTQPAMPRLYPDLPLDTTLRHLHRWPVLPVVSRANVRTLEGLITMEAVMHRYQVCEEPTAIVEEMAVAEPCPQHPNEADQLTAPAVNQ
jgi:CIC family chloride channel protein